MSNKQTARRVVSKISMIHDLFDTATAEITSKHIPEIAEKTGFNETTVRIQFYKWRANRAQRKAA